MEAAGDAVSRITAAGLALVTLELMDQLTIQAVDDWQQLGLDREAAAMLLLESDLPAGAADTELTAAERACEAAGATSLVRAQDPQEADWLRQARRMAYRALERLGLAGGCRLASPSGAEICLRVLRNNSRATARSLPDLKNALSPYPSNSSASCRRCPGAAAAVEALSVRT